MAIKNVSITVTYRAWDNANSDYKTGDSANHSIYVMGDGTNTVADNSPAEVDATNSPGLYKIVLSQAEMNFSVVTLSGKSSTADISLMFAGDIITEQGVIATAQADLDLVTGADGATLATSQGNYAPAVAGDLMGLANDAITSAKYDESTAFPVASADTGATAIARTGADSDTLETLSDQVDATLNTTTAATELTTDPGASPTLAEAIALLYMKIRNKQTVTGTTATLHNSAGSSVFEATLSDDGSTFTEGKIADA